MANQFLPFCPTDTGTNLPTQGDYAVDPNRSIGNSPGIASSKLNNKPLRQATFIASQIAQYISEKTGTDTLDDSNTARLLAQINAALLPIPDNFTRYTSGSGTFNTTFYFFILSGSASAGATYTNNGFTYTVVTTIASGVLLRCTGTGLPTSSGTLTKSGGTGDTTLTFYAIRSPSSIIVEATGAGAGGAGSGTGSPGAGTSGGATTFGSSLITAGGGAAAGAGGAGLFGGMGGTPTINSPAIPLYSIAGGGGGSGVNVNNSTGGMGGNSHLGGAGSSGTSNSNGAAGAANSGSGGGGSGTAASGSSAGGGAGAFAKGLLQAPLASYSFAYAVGASGNGGAAGTGGQNGGNGGSGNLLIREKF